jgi:hypothetical protein
MAPICLDSATNNPIRLPGPEISRKKDTVEDEAGAIVCFKNGGKLSINVSGLESNVRPEFFPGHGDGGRLSHA